MTEARPWAVLFDLDGTLVDSIALLLASMKHTFQGRPRQPTDAEWIEGLGTPLPKQLTPYVESDEDRERLVNRYRTFQLENHDRLMAHYEGVIDTLALLYQRGHPMGVVTSKGNMMMERGLKFIGADDYIEVAIGYDSVHIHKPDPYPVRAAAREAGMRGQRSRLRRRFAARHQVGQRGRCDHDRRAVGAVHAVSAGALQADLLSRRHQASSGAHLTESQRKMRGNIFRTFEPLRS